MAGKQQERKWQGWMRTLTQDALWRITPTLCCQRECCKGWSLFLALLSAPQTIQRWSPLSLEPAVCCRASGHKLISCLLPSPGLQAEAAGVRELRQTVERHRVTHAARHSLPHWWNIYGNAVRHLEIQQTGVARQTQRAAYGREGKTHLESNPSRWH